MHLSHAVAILLSAVGAAPVWAAQPAAGIVVAQADVRPLVSGERVRVQRLTRDIESARQTLDQGGVAPFQDPAYVEKWRERQARFRAALAKYPQVEDPDVRAAAEKLAEFEAMLEFGIRQGAKQVGELGDVQSTLAGIEAELRQHRAPQWLAAPFDDAEAARWVAVAARAKQVALAAQERLQTIAASAHLPLNPGTVQSGAPYDRHDLDRLIRFAADTVAKVDAAVQETLANLKTGFEAQNSELDYYRGLDPAKPADRMNAFLAEGAQASVYGALDRALAFANSVAAYQRAFGREPVAAVQGRIDEIRGLRERYAAQRSEALGASRLPEPSSTDAELVAIAERILAEPRYAFGRHGPVVLTTPGIVDREKQVSRAEIKDVDVSLSGTVTLSGTETTWIYRWQEFKFVTPLQDTDSGDWYLWWITAKRFSSGADSTPIGTWVSGAATKGDQILETAFAPQPAR
jgi:hypothetical protein